MLEPTPNDDDTAVQVPGEADVTGAAGQTGSELVEQADPRGGCNLDTGYAGDDACMLPPPAELGLQIHVGPDDYTNAAQIQTFIMGPGDESSECYMQKMPNAEQFYYDSWELSGRPGTHHIINTLLSNDKADGWGSCESFISSSNRVMSLEGASKPFMPRVAVAPENEGLGTPVPANLQGQFDMHYFNTGDEDLLREFWMNLYYKDPATVTETPRGIRGMGGLSWQGFAAIPANSENTYTYDCPVEDVGEGARIIQIFGHTHAHGVRETAWLIRDGLMTKVFEQFHYLDQQIFNFNSVVENPALDQGFGIPGAMSGELPVQAGDTLRWECEVINDSDSRLTYTNNVFTGEMCNLWGDTVNATFDCIFQRDINGN